VTDTLLNVPLFPLNSVVLPGGRIPLQLFEPRYIDMLTRCLREDQGFVVFLLKGGTETARHAAFYDVGTYVRIIDFQQLENGLLGITVEGRGKVALVRSWQQEDGLNMGDVEYLLDEAVSQVPERYHELSSMLQVLCRHPVVRDLKIKVDYSDAREVGWRLTELLPIDPGVKQRLAELQDPLERLQQLQELLEVMEKGT